MEEEFKAVGAAARDYQQSTPQPLVAPKSDVGGSTNFHCHTGKIGRLPPELREQVNLMIYEGIPYAIIIQKLGDAGKGLKPYHLTRWRKGGYQEWLKDQQRRALSRSKEQFALDILREKDAGKVHEAYLQTAAAQLCLFLADFDPVVIGTEVEW